MALLKRGQARTQWLTAILAQVDIWSKITSIQVETRQAFQLSGCGLVSQRAEPVQGAPDNFQRLDKCQVQSVGHRSLLGIHEQRLAIGRGAR